MKIGVCQFYDFLKFFLVFFLYFTYLFIFISLYYFFVLFCFISFFIGEEAIFTIKHMNATCKNTELPNNKLSCEILKHLQISSCHYFWK